MRYRLENDSNAALEGWAFLRFRTRKTLHDLARLLNRLYDLHLARLDDMTIDDTDWALFRYFDPTSTMTYYLTQRPCSEGDALWAEHEMLLIIKGDSAPSEAAFLYEDISDPAEAEKGDLLAEEHRQLVELMLNDFTLLTLLDFAPEAANTRRMQKELSAARQQCNQILDYFERNGLDLTPEELRRREYDRKLKNKFGHMNFI